jgi:MFS family permease
LNFNGLQFRWLNRVLANDMMIIIQKVKKRWLLKTYKQMRNSFMSLFPSMNHRGVWITTLMAAAILMITMGARQSMGLYVGPLNTDTGLGIVTISLAMAVGQFVWGAIQPIAGAFADKYGPRPVLLVGLLTLVIGSALTPFITSSWGLILTMGVLTAMGAGACSFSVLLGAAASVCPLNQEALHLESSMQGGHLANLYLPPSFKNSSSGLVGWAPCGPWRQSHYWRFLCLTD